MKRITVFILLFFGAQNGFALSPENNNSDIIRAIENSLLFSQKEETQIDLLNNIGSEKISGKIEKNKGKKSLNFQAFEVEKPLNLSVKKKEKIAYSAYKSGQYEVAIELYKQILNEDFDNDYARYCLALLYQKMRQFPQAKKLYKQLLVAKTYDREKIIANIVAMMIDDSPRDAIYLLSRLSSAHPKSPYLLAQTGLAYDKIKDYKNAALYLEKAFANDKSRIDYEYNLAILYDKNKQYERAVETYYDVIKNCNKNNNCQKTIPLKQVKLRVENIKSVSI